MNVCEQRALENMTNIANLTSALACRGRGGATARPVGVGVPRGTPTSRGVLSTRGPVSRGRGLLTPRARGVPPAGYRPPPPPPSQEAYGDYVSEGVRRQLWRSDWRGPYVRWGVAPSILCHLPSGLSTPPRFSSMYRVPNKPLVPEL